jgi:alkylhydroperoxidase family enzyme
MNASLMERLKKHFSDDTIIELTALIAFQNLSTKFNSALDVAAQGFCDIPSPKSAKVENLG